MRSSAIATGKSQSGDEVALLASVRVSGASRVPKPRIRPAAAISTAEPKETATERLAALRVLEQKVLWLSVWMIHHANHLRPKVDDLKIGGHQASSASVLSLMTALYFDALQPGDRVAVKPHASPVFHAIQYLFGHQRVNNIED